jgi:hypothetical protein
MDDLYHGTRLGTVREIASMVLPTAAVEGVLMRLRVRGYFDDSGTHANSDVVVIGGLFGTVEQWERFERAWAARLADPLPGYGKSPLKMFHLSACAGRWPGSGFEDYTDAEQDAVISDFRQIIIDSRLTSTSSAIDRRAWDELVVGPYRSVLGGPLNSCFFSCVDEVVRIVEPEKGGPDLAVMFDKGIWSAALQNIANSFEAAKIVSVTFGRVEKFMPLQGADIVATENYWHAVDWLKLGDAALPRPHLRHYLQNMLHQGLILDREAIANEVARRRLDGSVPQ